MADPDFVYNDGFDHYYPPVEAGAITSFDQSTVGQPLAEEYSVSGGLQYCAIIAPLTGTGGALRANINGNTVTFLKPLQANFARVVGGMTIANPSMTGIGLVNDYCGYSYYDGATQQLKIVLNIAGQIQVMRGSTLLATSVEAIVAGSTNCIEWDITFHASAGIVKVWLNKIPTSINLTGQNTSGSGVAQVNQCGPILSAASGRGTTSDWDHTYNNFYTAAGGTETPLLTNPIIETQWTNADSAAAWSVGAGALGDTAFVCVTNNAPGANQLALRKFTPPAGCTLGSIGILPLATSATAKFKAVLYSDSAGSPNALLATGTEIIGTVSGTRLALPFAAGQALTGGTAYWIGFITDTSVTLRQHDTTSALGQKKANTYTSGAPNPAGAMTTGQPNWLIWGNLTAVTSANYLQVDVPWASAFSFNFSATVGQIDRQSFPPLVANAAAIHCVTLVAALSKSDGGARTIDLLTKSGGTETSGSTPGISPSLSVSTWRSNWLKDPNTGLAWLTADLNAAFGGYKIAA
jgi:hypothetical protein